MNQASPKPQTLTLYPQIPNPHTNTPNHLSWRPNPDPPPGVQVTDAREKHLTGMSDGRKTNTDNDTKLEDEFEYLLTCMRQDGNVESLQVGLGG